MSALSAARQWALRLIHVDEHSRSMDVALLVIRIMVCICLLYHHGAEKLYDFGELLTHPRLDPIGIGIMPSVIIAGISDFLCCLLVLFGLFSRFSAAFVVAVLNVVWWLMDNGFQRLFGLPIHEAPRAAAPAAAQAAQAVHAAPPQAAHAVQHVVHTIPGVYNVPMYILGFLIVMIAGPGRYSLDKMLEKAYARILGS